MPKIATFQPELEHMSKRKQTNKTTKNIRKQEDYLACHAHEEAHM
jgi:hypothetical protein